MDPIQGLRISIRFLIPRVWRVKAQTIPSEGYNIHTETSNWNTDMIPTNILTRISEASIDLRDTKLNNLKSDILLLKLSQEDKKAAIDLIDNIFFLRNTYKGEH